ncbi:MAG: NUDIX hydrolase [bacterium]
MSENRFGRSGASHLFLVKDDKILLLRRFNTGWNDGNYSLVAGHIEEGETAVDAMVREAEEESGITIRKQDLSFSHICHRRKPDGEEKMDFFFECKEWSGKIVNAEPHKCDEIAWYKQDQLPSNMVDYIQHALGEWKKGNYFSTFGW